MAVRLLVRLLVHLRDDLSAQVSSSWRRLLDRLGRAWATRPPKRRLAARGLVVALLLLGLGSLDARARLSGRLPSSLDWRALTALLERDARPGDLVALFPPWLERAREAVPARLPVLATSALDAEWLPGVRRVWLVAAGGVSTFGPRPPLSSRSAAADTQQVGQLQVTRIDLAGPVTTLGSLAERGGAPARWRDVEGVARRCLELAPRPGTPARIELPRLRLGGALAGHAALLSPDTSAAARLVFRVDGGPTIPMAVTVRSGWLPFRIDTSGLGAGARTLVIEAEGPAGSAVCLEAQVLP